MLDHVVVDALEVRRGVAVVVGHDLLEHEVGGPDHVLVVLGQGHGHAQIFLDVGGRGEHLALAVPAHGSADGGVDDVAAGFGGGAHGRDKQPVRVVAVVVDDQIGVGLADGGNKLANETRRTHAGHVLEAQDDALGRLGLGHAAGLGGLVKDGLQHAEVMGHVEAPGPGQGDGRLEDDARPRQGDLGKGIHVVDVIKEIKAADDVVVLADHLARQPHEIARLGLVAQHVGGANEQLLHGLGRKLVPLGRLGEGVGHVGHHGHVEVRAAAVFQREKAAVVEIRPDQLILGQPEAVAAVGLGDVAGGGVDEMDLAGVAHHVENGLAVAARIGAFGRAQIGLGHVGREPAQAVVLPAPVLAQLDVGVVAPGRDLGHQPRQAHGLGLVVLVVEQVGVLGDELGVEIPFHEFRVAQDLAMKRDGRFEAADDVLAKRPLHDRNYLGPIAAVGNEQRAGGIVLGGKLIAGRQAGIEPDTLAPGRQVAGDGAGVGGEILFGVLAVDAQLHGVEERTGVHAIKPQLAAKGDVDLLFNQVHAVAAFGDAVLHLQAGVDLDHVRFAVGIDQEFHRGQGIIPGLAHQPLAVVLEALAQFLGHAAPGRRGDLHELLVVALHRTIAFVKGEHVAEAVAGHLDFDVAHAGEELFHEQARIAERGLGHGRSLGKSGFELGLGINFINAPAAAAAFGLEHDGEADLLGDLPGLGDGDRAFGAGHHRDAQAHGQAARLDLVAKALHGFGRGADEKDARFGALAGKFAVFGSKSPARVDGDHAPGLGFLDDAVDVEIGPGIGA